MLWKRGPIPSYQCMWYAPGMGKGAAEPCIGTIYFPSVLTWGRETDEPEGRVENDTTLTPAPSVGSSTQSSPDQPAPVGCGIWTTRGHLPWRYRNFQLLTDARPTDIWDVKVDPRVCLHILIWLYNTFKWGSAWTTLCWLQIIHAEHHSLSIQGDTLNVTFMCGFQGRKGSGLKDIWSGCNSLTIEKPKKNPMGERGVLQLHPK